MPFLHCEIFYGCGITHDYLKSFYHTEFPRPASPLSHDIPSVCRWDVECNDVMRKSFYFYVDYRMFHSPITSENMFPKLLCTGFRQKLDGEKDISIDYEFALLSVDGSVLTSRNEQKYSFRSNVGHAFTDFVEQHEVFDRNRKAYFAR
ncbi:hypothetical protein CEXT_99721 [Caerostris extrusa]|uniref:Uncharacterized protein n=1 Tax=Caerostris extrusa TaxID=172846 RepID=A0AAV4SZ85_CAEEX|nr:hypothetical protein CEXT_99721 [Caerostris extrusa]